MAMTVEDLASLLDCPEMEPDVPVAGMFGTQIVKARRGADGQEYAQVEVFDYTGMTRVFVRKNDWGSQLRRTPTVCTMAFTFVSGRHGELVPLGVPARGLEVDERSPFELLPVHACPDPADLDRLTVLADSLTRTAFRQFLEAVFSEQRFTWAFLTLPASQRCHHACRGGLLRHSIEVAEGVQGMLQSFEANPLLGEAAILVGLLHDVGKVLLALPEGHRVPCGQRDHANLIQYALQESLLLLRAEDRDAYDALWRVLYGYQMGEHYSVPLAAVVQAADRTSAQLDAVKTASSYSDAYWKPGCGGRRIWDPPG